MTSTRSLWLQLLTKGLVARLLAATLGLVGVSANLASTAATRTIEGTVTRVIDGDSLWLEPALGAAPLELRLQDIDAPEICQAWGLQAKQALQDLVLKKSVSVQVSGRDIHGRTLGTLYMDSVNVNKTLVQEGHAWSARYKFDRGPYVADERMAKALSRGFNREGGAVMPRDFRREHGPCATGEVAQGATGSASTKVAPGAMPASATPKATAFRCDGRNYCSQMHSCAEATWFLKNCPGMKMDGDGNGVPCEKQWCN